MISKVVCGSVFGVEGFLVEAEAYISNGLPTFDIVGLPDSAVKESKERVRAAITNTGFFFPPKRITINLAPAYIKKEGPSFDLPIAIAICHGLGYVEHTKDIFICGELALDGQIRPVTGVLPMIMAARENNIHHAIVPYDNRLEANLLPDMTIYGVKHIKEVIEHLNGNKLSPAEYRLSDAKITNNTLDYQEVRGQQMVKRALEISAAGGHNMLMIGPPGSGKTMMASRMPSILPPLSFEESLEVTSIYSVSNLLDVSKGMVLDRPFRAPHHTSSAAALTGGGRMPKPGEISLSHRGVLFLDELPEFNRNVLESLRQPMENKQVTVARVAGSATFPSDFILVGAMNPCPCGYLGDARCKCSSYAVQRYQQKISGPLLDRMDVQIELRAIPYEELSQDIKEESSAHIQERVENARTVQLHRQGMINSQLSAKNIKTFCQLTNDAKNMMKEAFNSLGLSARGYHKLLKVGRTIADLDMSKNIESFHIAEAIQYRLLDRKMNS